jgi:hypothetical protein
LTHSSSATVGPAPSSQQDPVGFLLYCKRSGTGETLVDLVTLESRPPFVQLFQILALQ